MRETQRERCGNEGVRDAGKEKRRRKRKKERKKGRKERKKERKERRREGGGWPTVAWPVVAGVGRSWPEKVAKAPSPREEEGVILVKNGDLEF